MGRLRSAAQKQRLYKAHPAEFQKLELRDIAAENRGLLLDLANLHDDGWRWFTRQWPLFGDNADSIRSIRDELRAIWSKTIPLEEAQGIIAVWMNWSPAKDRERYVILPWYPDLRTGQWLPNHFNLRARLVSALLEHCRALRRCTNPECPAPFFLAKRKSQRFCERGECTKYAQQRYALKWWDSEGRKRRAAKAAKSKKRRKHGARKKG
jgi:hypothetical protein